MTGARVKSTETMISLSDMPSPVGPLHIATVKDVLYYIGFDTPDWRANMDAYLGRHIGSLAYIEDAGMHARIRRELEGYFSGKLRRFGVKTALHGTEFQVQVWTVLRTIPWGTTSTYKAVAAMVGNADATRAAGGAIGHNPIPIVIPCHRVIGEDGKLHGFGGGIERKKKLLMLEGSILV